jgi:hypothetical protein
MPQINSPDILQALHEAQPYYGGPKAHRSRMDAHRHPLWILRVLNNIDKHRLLLVVVHTLNIERMYWGNSPGLPTPSPYLNTVALKEGTPVAAFDFGGQEPPADFDPHLSLKVVLREPEAAFISHVEVTGALDSLRSWVEWDVVNSFRPLLGLTPRI